MLSGRIIISGLIVWLMSQPVSVFCDTVADYLPFADGSKWTCRVTGPDGKYNHAIPSLSGQSRYKNLTYERDNEHFIKGEFNCIDIEKLIRRIYKRQNYILVKNEKRKELQIVILGEGVMASNNIDDTQSEGYDELDFQNALEVRERQIQAGKEKYELQGIDSVTGLNLQELAEMKEAQINGRKLKYDYQGIDSVSGLPLGKIEEIRANQVRNGKMKYQEQGIDPITGKPL